MERIHGFLVKLSEVDISGCRGVRSAHCYTTDLQKKSAIKVEIIVSEG